MSESWNFALLMLFAYIAGSIPFGKIAGKFYGIDIQKKGSGNIGFANARSVLGWKAGLFVLAGDVLKGYLPVSIAVHHFSVHQTMVVSALALAGHLFPIWINFKGGKGVATAFGCTLAINPAIGLFAAFVYLIASTIFRITAATSLSAIWSFPILFLIYEKQYLWFYVAIALLITWTHRTNMRKTWTLSKNPIS